jgi:hypothetical protein
VKQGAIEGKEEEKKKKKKNQGVVTVYILE